MRLVSLVGLLLVAGCATPGNFYYMNSTHDRVDGYTRYELGKNMLGGWNMITGGIRLDLLADKEIAENGKVTYDLGVYYAGSDWLYIAPGNSLRLMVDGKRMSFEGKGSGLDSRHVLMANLVTEKAYYPATRKQIEAIAAGTSATVKVDGASGFVEKDFTKENFDYLKRFLADMDKTPEQLAAEEAAEKKADLDKAMGPRRR